MEIKLKGKEMTRRALLKRTTALLTFIVVPSKLLANQEIKDDTKLFKYLVAKRIPIINKTFYFNHHLEIDYAENLKMYNCKLIFNIKEKYKTLFNVHKYKNLDIRNNILVQRNS